MTEQVRAREVAEAAARVAQLSTPVMMIVLDRVMLMPLVDVLDAERAAQVMEMVLNRVIRTGARVVVIDITGVPLVDAAVAGLLVVTAKAVRLLGADTILTGVGPCTAKAMVKLDMDVSLLHTRSRLVGGLELALQIVGNHLGTAA